MRAKTTRRIIPVALALALGILGGCGKAEEASTASSSVAGESQALEDASSVPDEESEVSEEEEEPEETSEEAAEDTSSEAAEPEAEPADGEIPEEVQDMVASSDEYATKDAIGSDDMVPVAATELVDGTYEIEVDSSSSMFRIVHCDLVVTDGAMTADLTLSGKGYLYIYPGTAVEAAMDDEANYIGFEEDADGAHVHMGFPVEALNKEVDCAAFSKRKEKWYDRTLVFLADGLPAEAYAGN